MFCATVAKLQIRGADSKQPALLVKSSLILTLCQKPVMKAKKKSQVDLA